MHKKPVIPIKATGPKVGFACMGKNKKTKKSAAGIQRSIEGHEEKIRAEKSKPNPNWDRVRHWEGEIRNWKRQLDRLRDRLPQKKR
jgi:hypothetical protein